MPSISMERAEWLRHAFLPIHREQFGLRIASLSASLVSVGLIAATLTYKLKDLEPPSILLLALMAAFGMVVLLFSKFLRLANREHNQSIGALDNSEREFQSVFNSVLEAILIVDDQGVCREANPAAEQLFGLCRRELIGQSVGFYYRSPREFHRQWELLMAEKFHQGETDLAINGEAVVVEFTGKMDCLPGRHLMILRDITQRRRAERSLLESEERFRQMATHIQEIFWMMDAESKHILYVNQAYETITGVSCESLRDNPSSYQEIIHPEDRAHVLRQLDGATQSGRFNEQFRILRPQGDVIWIWGRGFPMHDAGGKVRRLVGTALEITAQKEAEVKVVENLAMAKAAWGEAEALRKATLALTQDLHMDSVMDTLLRCLAELVPYTCARVLVPVGGLHLLALGENMCSEPGQRAAARPLSLIAADSPVVERVLLQKESVLLTDTRQEKAWRTFKGHEELRSWVSVPLLSSDEYLGFLSIGHREPNQFTAEHLRRAQMLAIPAAAAIQNARLYAQSEIYADELERRIADLRQAESALARQETRERIDEWFQKIFRAAPIAISITTLDDGHFVAVNEAFETRYGYTREELLGHKIHESAMWEEPADRDFMVTQLKHGARLRRVIARLRTKSGQVKVTAYSAHGIQLDGQWCILAVSDEVLPCDRQQSN